MEKKIYITDAGLGYKQYAYLIRLDETPNGYNYLCIDKNTYDDNDSYVIGEIVKDLEDMYVSESSYNIEDSPLKGSFLFEFFLKKY